MSEYEVHAWRDGRWWSFEIPSLSSPSPAGGSKRITAMGQAKSAAEIRDEAADVISLWTSADVGSIQITINYQVPDTVADALTHAKELDETGREALNDAAALRRQAVQCLLDAGLTQSDSAAILGISRQRVQQLVGSTRHATRR